MLFCTVSLLCMQTVLLRLLHDMLMKSYCWVKICRANHSISHSAEDFLSYFFEVTFLSVKWFYFFLNIFVIVYAKLNTEVYIIILQICYKYQHINCNWKVNFTDLSLLIAFFKLHLFKTILLQNIVPSATVTSSGEEFKTLKELPPIVHIERGRCK